MPMFQRLTPLSWAILITGGLILVAGFTFRPKFKANAPTLSMEDDLWTVYGRLGKIRFNAVNTDVKGVSVERGRDLVFTGTCDKADGKGRTKIQSPFFRCTACHNVKKEFADLTNINSEARLQYAIERDLPFLQGSTFYGLVNRRTFYNDDYQKKYGHVPIIKAANKDIRQAIQLCATQCAQGRWLEDFEVESLLAYFNTLGLKLKDLNLSNEEFRQVEKSLQTNQGLHAAVHLLESKYLTHSPAHFAKTKVYRALSPGALKDPKRYARGQIIYERSCWHCHNEERYSFYHLDDGKLSFNDLMSRTRADSKTSLYSITRHGTHPLAGSRAYMPLYPLEKLSEEQLEDLRIYVENRAAGTLLTGR